LIECQTYRVGFHNTSDNPKEYREDAEVGAAMQRDPIERIRRFATASGWWSLKQETEVLAEIRSEIDSTQRAVEMLPRPRPTAIFDHVYEMLPPRLAQQRSEVLGNDQ
jgi:TPP-dependent pyruvate/acetoin dehydrogenase alpha subunit